MNENDKKLLEAKIREEIENEDIAQFVDDVCIMLDVEPPVFVADDDYLDKLGSIARFEVMESGDTRIVLKSNYSDKFLLLTFLAHELRHYWQYLNFGPDWMKEKSKQKLSVDEYNLQKPELDSQAFTCFVMRDFYGIDIFFHELKDSTTEIIKKRADELEEEFYANGERFKVEVE